ncbi:MAG: YciI family protein [Dehalococcoidia bacterium]
MHYMLAIMYDPKAKSDGSPSKVAEHQKLEAEMRASGHYRSGGGLMPGEMFTKTVRHDADAILVTDGPFAETREVLGGYFLVECSEEDALAYAGRIAVDNRSWISVRQVFIYRP